MLHENKEESSDITEKSQKKIVKLYRTMRYFEKYKFDGLHMSDAFSNLANTYLRKF